MGTSSACQCVERNVTFNCVCVFTRAKGCAFWHSPSLDKRSSTETHGTCAVAGVVHTTAGFELHALLEVP